jgi:hypothetical protein
MSSHVVVECLNSTSKNMAIKAAKKSMLLSKHKINLLISANFRAIISQIKIEKTYHLML